MWTRLIWLRTGSIDWMLGTYLWTIWRYKSIRIFYPAEQAASQKLYSIKLVVCTVLKWLSYFLFRIYFNDCRRIVIGPRQFIVQCVILRNC
jgi:hypothetical protein